jgi:hypothetical protein
MAIHHDFWLTILAGKIVGKAVDMAYGYLRDLVRALVLYWFLTRLFLLFIAMYQKQKGRGYYPALSYPGL